MDVAAKHWPVQGRLADGGKAELQRLRVAERDVASSRTRDAIRQVPEKEDYVLEGYRRAFPAYGIDLNAPDAAVKVIRGSIIKTQLLASLDDWALAARGVRKSQTAIDRSGRQRYAVGETLPRSRPPQSRGHSPSGPNQAAPAHGVGDREFGQSTIDLPRRRGTTLRGLQIYPSDYWLNLLFADILTQREAGLSLHRKPGGKC